MPPWFMLNSLGGTLLWGHEEGRERNRKPNKTHNLKTLMSFQSRWPRSLSRLSQPKTTGGHSAGKKEHFQQHLGTSKLKISLQLSMSVLLLLLFSLSAFMSTKTTTIYLYTWKAGLFFPLPAAAGGLRLKGIVQLFGKCAFFPIAYGWN